MDALFRFASSSPFVEHQNHAYDPGPPPPVFTRASLCHQAHDSMARGTQHTVVGMFDKLWSWQMVMGQEGSVVACVEGIGGRAWLVALLTVMCADTQLRATATTVSAQAGPRYIRGALQPQC